MEPALQTIGERCLLCPNCGIEIEVSAALSAQLRENLRREFDLEVRQKDREIAKREENLRAREQSLEASQQALDEEIQARVAEQQKQIVQAAEIQAKKSVAVEIQDLQAQLTDSQLKLQEAQSAELQWRKERREFETQKRELELTVSRRLDEERTNIRDQAKREAAEENRLREADLEKRVADLRQQINDLKRKSEQGSQQAQGEVMELELETLLRNHFPTDHFEPVPVGVHGGDLLQHIIDANGSPCGTIFWEAKRTKAWSDAWLSKLRDDQRAARAHLAVLMTSAMPKSLATFGCIDGIWVTNHSCLIGLATALRAGMIEVGRTKRSLEGKQSKVDLIYHYVGGSEFRQRVEGIVQTFITFRNDLESEKRCLYRLWAKREKQIDRGIANIAGMCGDFSGILGTGLPQIANLELPTVAADSDLLALEPASADLENSPF